MEGGGGGDDGFQMIPEHCMYYVLYFDYYYISSTSDHQALDPRGWGPWVSASLCCAYVVVMSASITYIHGQGHMDLQSSYPISLSFKKDLGFQIRERSVRDYLHSTWCCTPAYERYKSLKSFILSLISNVSLVSYRVWQRSWWALGSPI